MESTFKLGEEPVYWEEYQVHPIVKTILSGDFETFVSFVKYIVEKDINIDEYIDPLFGRLMNVVAYTGISEFVTVLLCYYRKQIDLNLATGIERLNPLEVSILSGSAEMFDLLLFLQSTKSDTIFKPIDINPRILSFALCARQMYPRDYFMSLIEYAKNRAIKECTGDDEDKKLAADNKIKELMNDKTFTVISISNYLKYFYENSQSSELNPYAENQQQKDNLSITVKNHLRGYFSDIIERNSEFRYYEMFCKLYLFKDIVSEVIKERQEVDENYFLPLIMKVVCSDGNMPLLEFLIEHGANKEAVNEYQQTPLFVACDEGHLSIVQYLISKGANVKTVNKYQQTPLHIACEKGHFQIVQYLVEHSANIEALNKYQQTPLHVACQFNYLSIVQYLVEHGANIEAIKKYQQTPLFVACQFNYLPIVQYLISKGANIEALNKYQETPLFIACEKGHLSIVQYLISKGANVKTANKHKQTPLHIACEKGHLPIVKYLIFKGANIEAKDSKLLTPFDVIYKQFLTVSDDTDKRKYLQIMKYFITNTGAKTKTEYIKNLLRIFMDDDFTTICIFRKEIESKNIANTTDEQLLKNLSRAGSQLTNKTKKERRNGI